MKQFNEVMADLKLTYIDVADGIGKPKEWVKLVVSGDIHLSSEGEGIFINLVSDAWAEFTNTVLGVGVGTYGNRKVGHLRKFVECNNISNNSFAAMVGIPTKLVYDRLNRDKLSYASICHLKLVGDMYIGWDELNANLGKIVSSTERTGTRDYPGAMFVDELYHYVHANAKSLRALPYQLATLRTTVYPKTLMRKLYEAVAETDDQLLKEMLDARKALSTDPRVGAASYIAMAVLKMSDAELQVVMEAMPKV